MKNYKQQIIPKETVYHISYRKNRESILKNGLKANSNDRLGFSNAVFAHNCSFPTKNWYPCVLDYYNWGWDKEFQGINWDPNSAVFEQAFDRMYDIWAIDTITLKRKWFVDELGEKEFGKSVYSAKELYIVSFSDIRKEHIELCKLGDLKRHRFQLNTGWLEIGVFNIQAA